MKLWQRVAAIICMLMLATSASGQQNRGGLNYSAVLPTGLTYVTVIPSGPKFSIEMVNNNASDMCWIEVTGLVKAGNTTSTNVTTQNGTITAQQASYPLVAGGSYQRYSPNTYVPQGPIVVACASNNDSIAAVVQ